MDTNIVDSVYNALDSSTDELQESIQAMNTLEEKIKSGRYTDKVLKEEIYPKRDALRAKIRDDSARAISNARGLIEQYRADAEKLNNLNPAELTDDIKLLQDGIELRQSDIEGMLERNKENRTMTQIILRYAERHKIETGVVYTGGQKEKETARNLESILYYYKKWIAEPNAKDMLRQFFQREE